MSDTYFELRPKAKRFAIGSAVVFVITTALVTVINRFSPEWFMFLIPVTLFVAIELPLAVGAIREQLKVRVDEQDGESH